mmetsp:Transcript_90807/g.111160  ORF Transcript_90807/g.111160 Transcript_90807/m.111160 type:complete len:209 (+) Transcript_90807:96-722(+)
MFACCVPDVPEPAVVEIQAKPVLKEIAIQSQEDNASNGIFTVKVPAKRHSTLGLEVETGKLGPIVMEVTKGAVDDFNQLNPLRTIQPHDLILQIGEAKGTEAILARLAAPLQDGKFTLHRPRRMQIKLDKKVNETLGVKMTLKSQIAGAVITAVESTGLVAKWNAQHPSDAVSVSDRLLAVNGVTDLKETLAEELKKETDLELTLLKY